MDSVDRLDQEILSLRVIPEPSEEESAAMAIAIALRLATGRHPPANRFEGTAKSRWEAAGRARSVQGLQSGSVRGWGHRRGRESGELR